MDIAADFKLEDKMADITVNDLFISIWVFYTAGTVKKKLLWQDGG